MEFKIQGPNQESGRTKKAKEKSWPSIAQGVREQVPGDVRPGTADLLERAKLGKLCIPVLCKQSCSNSQSDGRILAKLSPALEGRARNPDSH